MPSWNQIVALWRGLTKRQQITVVAGAALVAGTLWAFVVFTGKADYKTLYTGLEAGEAQEIARRLDTEKIPYKIPGDGTSILVPASKLDAVRIDMASQGLPQTGRLGFELFDRPNWAGSDFAEKVNYQRALEAELERTIRTIDGVESVRVHLVLPHESLYSEQESKAKASVVIKLRGGRLSNESVYAITHLVASAVRGLQPEDVTVVDADGRQPILVSGHNGWVGGQGNDGPEAELEQKIVDALAPVVGAGHVKASVSVDYDLSSTETTNEAYDPKQTVLLASQISEEKTNGPGTAGVPGTTSNVPGEKSAATTIASTDSQSQRTENKTYGVTKTVRHMVQPAGRIKRITAAVLIDDATREVVEKGKKLEKRRKRTPAEMKQFQNIARAAIGFDAARGDQLSVENLSFEGIPTAKPLPPPSGIEKLAPIMNQWLGLVRYAALLLLFALMYLLILRPVKKQLLAAFRQMPGRLAEANSGAALQSPPGNMTLPPGTGMQLGPGFPPGAAADNERALKLKQQLAEAIKKQPTQASQVMQSWVQGEKNG